MKEQIISAVLEKMVRHLNKEQGNILEWTLGVVLDDYRVEKTSHEVIVYDGNAEKLMERFLVVKSLAGCTKDTIKSYRFYLQKLILNLRKPLKEVETNDLRCFLAIYKERRKIKNVSMDNMRRCYSNFFGWLHEEELIPRNPMKRIKRIKEPKVIKEPFSDEQMEKLRMSCQRERDIAMIEFLYASGVRVSEAVALNRDQIDFSQKECTVFGKGEKERTVYLNSRASLYLRAYLESRTDDNPALFVWTKKPYRRLSKEGIESAVRRIGKLANVEKTHPHRFRRTMATNAINRGMPIQEVKELLGHEKIDTTMIYCNVLRDNVKLSHKKYVA